MAASECPVCGATAEYHRDSGRDASGEQTDPAEEWCEACGFSWQQHAPGETEPRPFDVNSYLDAITEQAEETRAMLVVWDRVIKEAKETADGRK